MQLKPFFLAAAFLGASALAAAGQSSPPSPKGTTTTTGTISAATHCLDANGNAVLKSAQKPGSATTGSKAAGSAGMAAKPSSGSQMGSAAPGNLPRC